MSQTNPVLPAAFLVPLNVAKKVMNFIIIAVGCLMAVTFFAVVILRYIFHADLFAYEEWLMAAAFWMFFMASAMATHDRMHINADILGLLISNPKWIRRRAIVVSLLELVILATLTWWGYLMVAEEFAAYPGWQTTIALKIPFVIPRSAIFIGFLMMTVFTALQLYVAIINRPSEELETVGNAKERTS